MRQIYNIESPPTRTEDSSPNTTPTGNDGATKSLFKCPLASTFEPKLMDVEQSETSGATTTSTSAALSVGGNGSGGEILKCLATCANASRLSLANLLPSRSD